MKRPEDYLHYPVGGKPRGLRLLRRRRRIPPPPTPYVSFQLEKRLSRDATIIWVLDRELRERSRYWVYRN